MKPPRVLKTADPAYTSIARVLKANGDVQIAAVVGADGSVKNLSITHPAGLDEQSTAAVLKYQFAPATRDGTPVPVEILVDVNFAIF